MQDIKTTLTALFNLRAGEELPTILMTAHSFFIGMAQVFLATASYTLFLTQFSVNELPLVYIYAAGVNVTFGLLYTRLEQRIEFSNLLLLTIGLCFLSITGFYILLKNIMSAWIVMAFAVCYNVLYAFTSLEFWSLAGRLFNVRQGKRLFGLIGVGEIFAGIIGGFLVEPLSKILGTENLLLFSIGGLGCCLGLLYYITQVFKKLLAAEPEEEDSDKKANGLTELFKNRYLLLAFGVNALSVIGNYTVDWLFYNQVEIRYTDEHQIAGFLGVYYAVFRFASLISNTFLSSRLMMRFGLSIGLLAFPGVITIGAGAAVIALDVFDALTVFFWIIVGMKVFDEVIRISIEEPSIRILCQPIQPAQRMQAMTMLENVVEPIAAAVTGGLLLIASSKFSFEAIHFIGCMFGVLALWLAFSFLLRQEYTRVLTHALTRRKLAGREISLQDGSSIAVLQKGLNSTIPGEVIYCLNMLEEIEHPSLEAFMFRLLEHPEPPVRAHVLQRIGVLGMESARVPVRKRIDIEESLEVRSVALQTLCAIGEADAFEPVFPYLEHENPELRKGAMIGLLRHGGIDGVLAAGAHLNTLLNATTPEDRKLAAQVLGEVGIQSFYRPLLRLLQDEDTDVRRMAIAASGKLKNPRLLPDLLANFSVPSVSHIAASAVTAFGKGILTELEAAFDQSGQNRSVRIKLARIIGKIGGDKAIAILKKKMDYPDEDVRNHLLEALVSCRYQAVGDEVGRIRTMIYHEMDDATWALAAMMDIGDDDLTAWVIQALEGDLRKNRKRIFLLLAMIYPSGSILSAQNNLNGASAEKRANAMEVLDNILSADIKSIVFPLIDDLTPAQRYARLVTEFSQARMGRYARLKEIIARSRQWVSSWTKACAVFTAGKIAASEFYDAVMSALSDSDAVVRETAVWALGCLHPNDLVQRLQPMTKDKSERVAKFARLVMNSAGFADISMREGYLIRSGRYTADLFANILHDESEHRIRRRRAAHILSRFESPVAASALLNGLTISDKTIRAAILEALIKGKFSLWQRSASELIKLFRIELEDAGRLLTCIMTVSSVHNSALLVPALIREMNNSRKRMLSILTLIDSFHHKDTADNRKTVVATLHYWYGCQENRIAPPTVADKLRQMLTSIDSSIQVRAFALFQHKNPAQLSRVWGIRVDTTPESVEQELKNAAFGSLASYHSWPRICAIDLIRSLNLLGCVPQMVEALKDPDETVRAAAAWALFKLNSEVYRNFESNLSNDPSPLVSGTVRRLNVSPA